MVFAGRVSILGCLLTMSVPAFAALADDYANDGYPTMAPAPAPAIRSQRKSKTTRDLISHWSVLVPSFVVHGMQPEQDASVAMPRKVDSSGSAVVTPGIGLQYEEDGFMALLAGFKDCYNDLAGALELGQYWKLGRTTQWGYTLGIYARETPMVCNGPRAFSLDGPSDCYSLDNYDWKFMVKVNNEWVDIIPMPFLHFSASLYKDKDFEVDFKLMSNIALNEFGFSIPF